MTTIINTPTSDSNNSGAIIGIIALIIFGLLFFYYGIPALRSLSTSQTDVSSPVINIPDQVDVNVQPAQ